LTHPFLLAWSIWSETRCVHLSFQLNLGAVDTGTPLLHTTSRTIPWPLLPRARSCGMRACRYDSCAFQCPLWRLSFACLSCLCLTETPRAIIRSGGSNIVISSVSISPAATPHVHVHAHAHAHVHVHTIHTHTHTHTHTHAHAHVHTHTHTHTLLSSVSNQRSHPLSSHTRAQPHTTTASDRVARDTDGAVKGRHSRRVAA
jgi:hypothetical protein